LKTERKGKKGKKESGGGVDLKIWKKRTREGETPSLQIERISKKKRRGEKI